MRVENYDKLMEKTISELKKTGTRKKLLLHACCAPCSSACIERLKSVFDVTVYFYNPNMDTLEEYTHREKEQIRLCEVLGVDCFVAEYNPQEFYSEVKGFENEPEGGSRCAKCFFLRLKRTAEYAKKNGYDYFTTSLTISPLKNAHTLNLIGNEVAKEIGVNFLPSDFKKKNGYIRSIELSKEHGLYRQNYCGCVFSKNLVPNE